MHPSYQEKTFQEINTTLTEDSEITLSHIQNFKYLDMVISESMRVIAPVPIVARQTSKDFQLSNEFVIPKGVQIAINIFSLHRNKSIWGSDSNSFNPEHFSRQNCAERHPYSFIPFTKGMRNCIGIYNIYIY